MQNTYTNVENCTQVWVTFLYVKINWLRLFVPEVSSAFKEVLNIVSLASVVEKVLPKRVAPPKGFDLTLIWSLPTTRRKCCQHGKIVVSKCCQQNSFKVFLKYCQHYCWQHCCQYRCKRGYRPSLRKDFEKFSQVHGLKPYQTC